MPEETAYPRPTRRNEAGSGLVLFTATAKDYVLALWRGEAPLSTVFWRDMLLAGSLINLMAALAAMALLAWKAPIVLALLVFFSPLPANLFLFIAVWRCSERSSPPTAFFARLAAAVWLIVATTIWNGPRQYLFTGHEGAIALAICSKGSQPTLAVSPELRTTPMPVTSGSGQFARN